MLTSVPSSSTSSVTFCPSKPDCDSDDVDHQRRALERGPRRDDAADLDVFRQRLAADADGEHRQALGLEAEQRVAERRIRGVGAVAHHHQPGHRQAGQLLPHARQRRAEPRLRSAERQVALLRRARRPRSRSGTCAR